nr:hypothetical protein [Mycoplasmopsis bovis]
MLIKWIESILELNRWTISKISAAERLKKVIDGEQGGISKFVNWQGTVETKVLISLFADVIFLDKYHKAVEC